MQIINKFKELMSGDNDVLMRNLLLIGMIGVIFILMGNFFTEQSGQPVKREQEEVAGKLEAKEGYAEKLSRELEKTLSAVRGAGRVMVQVYIDKSSTFEYEYNTDETNKITNETDRNGGEREIREDNREDELVVIEDAGGNEQPVIKVEKKPAIKSVLIVAEGANDSEIKYQIYRAVGGFLDLPLHKINVLPSQGR